MKLTNKQYQALGKVSVVQAVYLLDDQGERIRSLPRGSEGYLEHEVEIVKTKVLTYKELQDTLGSCKF